MSSVKELAKAKSELSIEILMYLQSKVDEFNEKFVEDGAYVTSINIYTRTIGQLGSLKTTTKIVDVDIATDIGV